MWFKVNSLSAANTLFSIKNNTTGQSNETPHLLIDINGEKINHAFWGNDIYFGGYGGIVPNKWYHISTTYSGGSDTSSRKMFLNGVELGISSTNGTIAALNVNANSTLRIGVYPNGVFPFNGSIANFRLYNQALSADEIWELYAYQKEYFGVSPDVVTLKAGRLGIGTSEPRAVLDVRGDLRAGCPVFFQAAATGSTINATQLIPYNNVLNNKGGGYNPSTRLFTAPIAGFYHFSFYHMSHNSQTEGMFTLNGTYVKAGGTPIRVHSNVGGSHSPASASLNVYMNASDTMGISLTSGNMFMSASQYAGFNGFYLSS
jgi:hypothetical protein